MTKIKEIKKVGPKIKEVESKTNGKHEDDSDLENEIQESNLEDFRDFMTSSRAPFTPVLSSGETPNLETSTINFQTPQDSNSEDNLAPVSYDTPQRAPSLSGERRTYRDALQPVERTGEIRSSSTLRSEGVQANILQERSGINFQNPDLVTDREEKYEEKISSEEAKVKRGDMPF